MAMGFPGPMKRRVGSWQLTKRKTPPLFTYPAIPKICFPLFPSCILEISSPFLSISFLLSFLCHSNLLVSITCILVVFDFPILNLLLLRMLGTLTSLILWAWNWWEGETPPQAPGSSILFMLPRIPIEVNWKFYVWLHMYASGGILIIQSNDTMR